MPGDGGEPTGPAVLLDHDGGQTVGRPRHLDLLTGGVRGVVAAEHQHLVGVLVVRHEQLPTALTGQREESEEVVVVTELAGLGRGGLALRVEGGSTAQDGLTPTDDDILAISTGDGDGVGGVRRDGAEPEPARGLVDRVSGTGRGAPSTA